MNWLKSGPELKLSSLKPSELKVPTFLVDLYWDLRERHLLPLVGLVVAGIVAVPFLLSSSAEPQPVAGAGALAAPPSPETHPASLTVVEAKPGLRDYHKRLRIDTPADPFVQRYTEPQLAGTKLGGGGGSTSTTSTVTTTSSSGSTATVTKRGGPGGSTITHTTETEGTPNPGGSAGQHLTLFAFAVDVKIVRTHVNADGTKQTDDPVVRHRVVPPAPLPSEKTQAVTYLGLSPKTRMPFFVVSDEVTSVFGEGKCLSGATSCQLIELEPGFPETFVLGQGATRYKITVLKVEPVVTGHT